jgi:serine/threonine-protein phosphatase 4 regulatory subunit 1
MSIPPFSCSPRGYFWPFLLVFFLGIDFRMQDTQDVLIPIVESLVEDPESVIRQHLAAQLLPMGLVCMIDPGSSELPPVSQIIEHPEHMKEYNKRGYELVTGTLIQQLGRLVADEDVDVRRAAADTLTGLAVQISPDDIPSCILSIPLRMSKERAPEGSQPPSQRPGGKPKKSEAEQRAEDLRMTSANLLAELGGALAEHPHIQQRASKWVGSKILPAILQLSEDPSFRVRRAAAQALPRIVGTCDVATVSEYILPAFDRLSRDELYRVRKSTGECLVDMSRSLMILASHQKDIKWRQELHELRRDFLIPIADRLIQDEHKMVRQGMMQFLGPFMASFYPYQDSTLRSLLPTSTESDGSNHMGIVAQFFPHATSMVSRLNSSQNTVGTAPSPVLYDPYGQQKKKEAALDHLERALPLFLQASRRSLVSLAYVVEHRNNYPPDSEDIQAIVQELLDYFAALAIVSTGDENTDAEMRVYCAYSFPAIVLLLGAENWEGALKTCFFTLLNPSFAADDDESGISQQPTEPPLPVKRCLASSLHTISHILGSEIAAMDILPVLQDFFMRDPDESVRLNVIRGFPAILSVLPEDDRSDVFLLWSKIMRGDDCLGAKKRSATNPLVLNWRQRDYLARGLPDLIGCVSPDLIHSHLWPILKELLMDTISQVREDAIWTIPVLLKAYTPETAGRWPQIKDAKRFSTASTTEVLDWMKATILKVGERSRREADFVERQLYCRACATIGLALRFNSELKKASGENEEGGFLGESFRSLFFGKKTESVG